MPFFAILSTFTRLAPPCGVAEVRAMTTLDVCKTMKQKLLKSASIARAYQFAKPGKAAPNFVTLPRLTRSGTASRPLVPQETFDTPLQRAVLLKAGSTGRRAFIDFVKGPEPHGGSRQRLRGQAWS